MSQQLVTTNGVVLSEEWSQELFKHICTHQMSAAYPHILTTIQDVQLWIIRFDLMLDIVEHPIAEYYSGGSASLIDILQTNKVYSYSIKDRINPARVQYLIPTQHPGIVGYKTSKESLCILRIDVDVGLSYTEIVYSEVRS